MEIKDSGNRRIFANGGVRDMAEGKGRCDLLPLEIVGEVFRRNAANEDANHVCCTWEVLEAFDIFLNSEYTDWIYDTIINFSYTYFGNLETAMLEVAIHFEMGAKKYEPRNWEKIGETDTFVDSAIRHYLKFIRGDKDEPHDRAFLWNCLCLLWTHEHYKRKEEIHEPCGTNE